MPVVKLITCHFCDHLSGDDVIMERRLVPSSTLLLIACGFILWTVYMYFKRRLIRMRGTDYFVILKTFLGDKFSHVILKQTGIAQLNAFDLIIQATHFSMMTDLSVAPTVDCCVVNIQLPLSDNLLAISPPSALSQVTICLQPQSVHT